MRFGVDFNREDRDSDLVKLGAVLQKHGEYSQYEIEIADFKELEELERKVEKLFGWEYSLIISFDSPMIYLDNV